MAFWAHLINIIRLAEKSFKLDHVDPVIFFGPENRNLDLLRNAYPNIKFVARGDQLKVKGPETELNSFSKAFERVLRHITRYKALSPEHLEQIVLEWEKEEASVKEEDVLVFGNGGKPIRARTPNQQKMVEALNENDLLFAVGPAGTGKTYTAVALAVKALKDKQVKRIILTRPAVEAGENLGFLPGDLKDKLDPYLQPLYDALRDMIQAEKLAVLFEQGVVQIAPLAFMRGRTLDNAFVILDEAQNATETQLKMFLTRMGKTAKFAVTGDLTQVDLPTRQKSGLPGALRRLKNIKGISVVTLNEKDVIRHRLVSSIIAAYKKPIKDE